MRFERARFGGRGATRAAVARLAAFACIAGVILAFASPLRTVGQDEPTELVGVFSVTIGREDVPRTLAGGPALIGLWTLTFNGDGTYVLARQDVGVVASGSFTAEGATLTFNDWNGLLACGAPTEQGQVAAEEAAATYAWKRDGDVLTLTPITETCTERRILFTTRSFGGYETCTTTPLMTLSSNSDVQPIEEPAGTPVPTPPAATPGATPGVAIQEERAEDAGPEEAIDALLRQATGCWATGDPARFLALHSQNALDQAAAFAPLPQFASDLQTVMATPVAFERIGEIQIIDPTHAWAYVEVTFGPDRIPQRFDFVLENGVWLFDSFFLFGPADQSVPDGEPPAPEAMRRAATDAIGPG